MLHAVVMAGGVGSRFWPRSRRSVPKQFIPLVGKRPLVRETVDRIADLVPPERVLVVTNEAHVARAREALPELPAANVIAEPVGRDTAPCIGLAATILEARDPEAIMVALPADHFIRPREKLLQSLRAACDHALRSDALILFGIRPTSPATGYGYMWKGEKAAEIRGAAAYRVRGFIEKPVQAKARELVATGEHFWNSGIFLWRAAAILAAIRRHAPELGRELDGVRDALGTPGEAAALRAAYARCPRISIDYAVLEKAEDVVMLEATYEWDDVGSWRSMEDILAKTEDGNVVLARHCGVDTSNSIILGEDHLIATVGVSDLIIVHTKDATLICHKDRAQDVKKLVEKLEKEGLDGVL
ncbi:MAG: mannose-1-phosphate guanylyltransferase [Planctomycetes bacterium]|nr:mannose-1-phosphate guanylyltransferase [Planctomycetota bacterium]